MSMSEMLAGCPLFYELYDNEVEQIARNCNVYQFSAGEKVVRDGDEGHEIYIILEGKLHVEKQTAKGVIRIQPLAKGDVFGEMVLVDENQRSADIVAESKTHVLEISYDTIFDLFKADPRTFGLVMLNLSRMIAKRLRASNEIIKEIREKVL